MKKAVIICTLTLALALTTSSWASDNIQLAFKGGVVDNFSYPGLTLPRNDLGRQGIVGGQVFLNAPPYFDVIVAMDYSWQKKTYRIDGQAFDFKTRDMSVSVSVVYPFNFSVFHLYAGGGVGSHSYSHEYYRPRTISLEANGVTIPEIATYLGYHAVVGAKMRLPSLPAGFFMEGRIGEVAMPDKNITYNNWTGGIFISLP